MVLRCAQVLQLSSNYLITLNLQISIRSAQPGHGGQAPDMMSIADASDAAKRDRIVS